jgi:hypothetical protein
MVGPGINVIPFMIQRNVPGIADNVLLASAFAAVPAVLAGLAYAILVHTIRTSRRRSRRGTSDRLRYGCSSWPSGRSSTGEVRALRRAGVHLRARVAVLPPD